MALVRGQTLRLDIPHEPGEWVTIKKLPWGLLDGAREARTRSVIERAKVMGPELMASLRDAGNREDVQQALADEVNEYDRGFLLRHGVAEWSYEEAPADAVEDLDEVTADWLAREIVRFNSRVRTEAEQLDAMLPSTSP